VVNQAGASGSVGTNSVLQQPRRLYLGVRCGSRPWNLQDPGMLDTVITDWVLYLSVANIQVFAVNANSPYKTMDDLIRHSRTSRARSPLPPRARAPRATSGSRP